MLETWLFTVSSVTDSTRAISRFDRPWARALRTSVSRGVSEASGSALGPRSSLSRRAVAAGSSTLSPRAAARTDSITWSTPAVLGR